MHRLLTGSEAGHADEETECVRLWTISRLCDEFRCLPAQAERLWLDDPGDTAIQIVELRAYAAALRAYQQVDGKIDKLDESPMMDRVLDNIFALHRERVAAREADD